MACSRQNESPVVIDNAGRANSSPPPVTALEYVMLQRHYPLTSVGSSLEAVPHYSLASHYGCRCQCWCQRKGYYTLLLLKYYWKSMCCYPNKFKFNFRKYVMIVSQTYEDLTSNIQFVPHTSSSIQNSSSITCRLKANKCSSYRTSIHSYNIGS